MRMRPRERARGMRVRGVPSAFSSMGWSAKASGMRRIAMSMWNSRSAVDNFVLALVDGTSGEDDIGRGHGRRQRRSRRTSGRNDRSRWCTGREMMAERARERHRVSPVMGTVRVRMRVVCWSMRESPVGFVGDAMRERSINMTTVVEGRVASMRMNRHRARWPWRQRCTRR